MGNWGQNLGFLKNRIQLDVPITTKQTTKLWQVFQFQELRRIRQKLINAGELKIKGLKPN